MTYHNIIEALRTGLGNYYAELDRDRRLKSRSEYFRKWYKKNREYNRQRCKAYIENHREEYNAYSRKWRNKNPEKCRQYRKKYQALNPSKVKESSKSYYNNVIRSKKIKDSNFKWLST